MSHDTLTLLAGTPHRVFRSFSRSAPCRLYSSRELGLRYQELGQTLQIQDPSDQVTFLPNLEKAPAPEAPQPVPVLSFAEQLLDFLPTALRETVGLSPDPHPHPRVSPAASPREGSDVRRDLSPQHRANELFVEEPLVGTHALRVIPEPAVRMVQDRQASPLFRSAPLKDLHANPQQYPVAILHHSVHQIPGKGSCPRRSLGDIAAVRIRRRAMGPVAPFLPPEVHRTVPGVFRLITIFPVLGAHPLLILFRVQRQLDRHEALEARVCPHQRPVRRGMSAHQSRLQRLLHRLVEEALQHSGLVETATPVLAKGGMVPRVLIQIEPHEPSKRHVALQLHHQPAFARNPEQVAAHQRQEQLLGRNRRSTDRGVEGTALPPDGLFVDQRTNPPKRVILRHERLKRQAVVKSQLWILFSDHQAAPPSWMNTGLRRHLINRNDQKTPLSTAC